MNERTSFIPDTHELAWAAGFFDGEGNIRAKPNKQHARIYYHPTIFMPQVDRQVLDRFHRAVGGLGKVTGPWDRTRYAPNRRDQWYYEAFSFERAQAITAMLWNWLSPVKREQARVVFTTIREHPPPNAKLKQRATCSEADCGRLCMALGLCGVHYCRQWRQRQRA